MTGLTGDSLARALEVDRKTVTNWINADPPCPSTGAGKRRRFNLKQVFDWYAQRKVRELETELLALRAGEPTKDDVADARRRQTIAESRVVEIELAEREARIVAIEHVEEVVAEIAERIQPVLLNLPSNYTLNLEQLGIPPEKAQPVLEAIAQDLTRALRGTADDLEADDGPDPHLAA